MFRGGTRKNPETSYSGRSNFLAALFDALLFYGASHSGSTSCLRVQNCFRKQYNHPSGAELHNMLCPVDTDFAGIMMFQNGKIL
jgi:hypothetical protein